ncbi:Snf7-domain-containing protein [Xylariomycetidae sp. FL0641]|nr:Snf7-domain-containing protein [Xylariomycetidae sp. FL0641]
MSDLLTYLVENDPNFRKQRLPALYSDFSAQRTLNPDGYAANVAAWKRGLANAAAAGQIPSKSGDRNHLLLDLQSSDALLRSLESKQFGRPLGLGTALQEAMNAGELLPLAQFLKAAQSIYYKSWASIPWAVLGWGLRQVGLTAGAPSDAVPNGRFVVLPNVEAAARAFSEATADLTSPFERTFSRKEFRRAFATGLLGDSAQRLSDTDFDVLTTFLARDKGVLATDNGTGVVKVLASSEPPTITPDDAAIASLKELTTDLTRQADALSARVDALAAQAQDAVRRKNLTAARSALSARKRTEAALATRHATLAQLEAVAEKLQQAADHVALVRVLEASGGALRSLNARVGGADRVDAVLDGLREQMGEVDEVGEILAAAQDGGKPVDEEEVEDEFEALVAEERRKEEEKEAKEKRETEEKEAEETRRKLAELERLGPVPAGGKEKEEEKGVTATAGQLGHMHIDSEQEPKQQEQRRMLAE